MITHSTTELPESLKDFEKKSLKPISLREYVKLFCKNPQPFREMDRGFFTTDVLVYLDNRRGETYFLEKPIIFENARTVNKKHKKRKEFIPSGELRELIQQEKLIRDLRPIKTTNFKNSETAKIFFGELAEKYGLMLNDEGITHIEIIPANYRGFDFVRPVYVKPIKRGASIYGGRRNVYYDRSFIGVA